MNATAVTPATNSPRPAEKTWADFRLIPRIETFPRVVACAQTPAGKVALLATFGLALRFFAGDFAGVAAIVLPLGVISFLPEYRRFVLALAPICLLVFGGRSAMTVGLTLAVIAAGISLFWCATRWPKSFFGRRPILCLLSGFALLIFIACSMKPQTRSYIVLWELVGVFTSYVWFIGYAVTDRSAKPKPDTSLELASFRPLWGSTTIPFPKGAAYLRRIEAREAQQLAVVQLKGLKLLVWAILLALLQSLFTRLFYGDLRIPTSAQSLAMSVHGTPAAWHVRWESQILFFLAVTLNFAVHGHQIIAICRMAGFNALRNSYRPLSSTTIAEFFNRFYYYYKELLVDFFFYPTFLRYWKGHKRTRIIFATFAAVVFGNSFFHLTRDWNFIQQQGLWKALVSYQVLFFYSVVLAVGLSISQLRRRSHRATHRFCSHVLPTLGVLLFYCLLGVFIDEDRLYPLTVHLRYLGSLFFIHF